MAKWKGVSLEEWIATGQYPDGKPLDKNDHRIEEYYDNYKKVVTKANKDGDIALKKAVERQHGIIDTGTATKAEKEGYVDYVLSNPDLRETAEALGLTQNEMAEFGQKQYETHEVGQYKWDYREGKAYIDRGDGLLDYSVTRDSTINNRLNRLSNAGGAIIGNEDLVSAALNMSDADFQSLIRGIESDPAGYGTSRMWQARGLIGDEFGDPWNLAGFSGIGWNMDPDNPYARGIRAGTIDVAEDVGQLLDTGDPQFLQDRYEDDYRKEDFPDDWVDDEGNWQGPSDLGEYWNAISTAVRNEEGDLRSLIPSSQWTNYGKGGPTPGVGPGVGGLISTTPYTQPAPQDWSAIMPTDTPLVSQQALVSGQGKFYQPWATGQGVPQGLLNYQVPGGAPVNVTYSGGNPSLFDFNNGVTTSGDTTTTAATTAATGGTFMGQPYSNTAQYHNLLSLHNKAMQLIRGGHNQGRGIGQLMANPNWVNTQYGELGGTDPIVGGGSFGNYVEPPGETAPFYYGDTTANPHL